MRNLIALAILRTFFFCLQTKNVYFAISLNLWFSNKITAVIDQHVDRVGRALQTLL